MEECIIVISTYSSYIDVCSIFYKLLKINWKDCPYRIVFAVIGEKVSLQGAEIIYVGENGLLSDCIVTVKNAYPAEYYLCLLGDAMICSEVNTNHFRYLLKQLKNEHIKYLKLKPSKKSKHSLYRKPYYGEAYVYTFAAFLATGSFINDEIYGYSDFEFEMTYYRKCIEKTIDYRNIRVMNVDILHIVWGIGKGKWYRSSYKLIKKIYPELDLSNRNKLSCAEQIKVDLYSFISKRISIKYQYRIKTFLSAVGLKFYMNIKKDAE